MPTPTEGIDPGAKPSGDGCAECLASGGWWLHLRRCALCGHVGCCDASPGQHTSHHHAETGHPFVASFEPGEDWLYDYRTGDYRESVPLAPPESHPESQSVPGGKVPPDWASRLRA